ncbi:hypothetical protein OF83DRAFT_1294653 [Amylostereum chailletii]|nr:hypothetical protein OF83DRAFT_1294653 [Amylostereum chailletii]
MYPPSLPWQDGRWAPPNRGIVKLEACERSCIEYAVIEYTIGYTSVGKVVRTDPQRSVLWPLTLVRTNAQGFQPSKNKRHAVYSALKLKLKAAPSESITRFRAPFPNLFHRVSRPPPLFAVLPPIRTSNKVFPRSCILYPGKTLSSLRIVKNPP